MVWCRIAGLFKLKSHTLTIYLYGQRPCLWTKLGNVRMRPSMAPSRRCYRILLPSSAAIASEEPLQYLFLCIPASCWRVALRPSTS